MKKQKINLDNIFLSLQEQMFAKLSWNRKIISHPVTKGDATELEWCDMLSNYLPRRYQAEKAFVIDSNEMISEQIDIVIFDRQYSPFLLKQNGAIYVPAESVYAVIEVKPKLSSSNIRAAEKKAKSVKSLYRTSGPIYHAGGIISKPKAPFEILSGILTIDGKLSKQQGVNLLECKAKDSIDFGCSLKQGSFFIYRKENKIEQSKKDNGLIFFFLTLIQEFQKLGTVPAIEMEKYIKNIQ